MWPRLNRDFNRLRKIKGWGAAHALVDALLLDNGFQALIAFRIGSTFRRWGVPLVPALCRRLAVAFCGIDILPQAEIGGGCYIPHGVGLVVGGATSHRGRLHATARGHPRRGPVRRDGLSPRR